MNWARESEYVCLSLKTLYYYRRVCMLLLLNQSEKLTHSTSKMVSTMAIPVLRPAAQKKV